MTFDYRADPDHACHFDVVDLDTGLSPAHPETGRPLRVFYADDEAGVIRFYKVNSSGVHYVGPGGDEVAWGEVRGVRIKVIPRAEGQRLRALMPAGC